ncbi:hypothetical protein N7509_010719 [Penicillium cosmopolitanum]|uniref:Uncharacterized protein n=1 Tax=Penicillium cosmopolitanum TaxID=1131564 RepID=A0A9W9VRU9_9EURO|nr:uncharacterized protein N7509_010719 [Penicillium cosmopolitanum]KAJ5388178.1 hypothetical protein N7509_010719 [Penicillium cosmopolitanum]
MFQATPANQAIKRKEKSIPRYDETRVKAGRGRPSRSAIKRPIVAPVFDRARKRVQPLSGSSKKIVGETKWAGTYAAQAHHRHRVRSEWPITAPSGNTLGAGRKGGV